MKKLTLILLLLLPIGMMGQNDTSFSGKIHVRQLFMDDGSCDTPITSHWEGYRFFDITENTPTIWHIQSFRKSHSQIEIELLWLLEQYQTECFNDSTHTTFARHITWRGDTLYGSPPRSGEMPTYPEPEIVKIWTHKQPTFIGFIKWLKERNE